MTPPLLVLMALNLMVTFLYKPCDRYVLFMKWFLILSLLPCGMIYKMRCTSLNSSILTELSQNLHHTFLAWIIFAFGSSTWWNSVIILAKQHFYHFLLLFSYQSWLLHDRQMDVRTTYEPFMQAARSYLRVLIREIEDMQVSSKSTVAFGNSLFSGITRCWYWLQKYVSFEPVIFDSLLMLLLDP